MTTQAFSVPIVLEIGVNKKKNYYLNLNKYKQWHFQESNNIKRTFKLETLECMRELQKVTKPCKMTYTIYYSTKRAFDLDNIGSIVAKFTQDALVELEILEDDDYHHIVEVQFLYGGVDKDNPRCDIVIEEIDDEQE